VYACASRFSAANVSQSRIEGELAALLALDVLSFRRTRTCGVCHLCSASADFFDIPPPNIFVSDIDSMRPNKKLSDFGNIT
jgi:hypothetical protein